MLGLTTRAVNTLRGSHSIQVYAIAHAALGGVVDDVPVISGSLVIDATSQVRRTATVGIAYADLWPDDVFSALSPLGSELTIVYGIVLGNGEAEWLPLIRGPITRVTRSLPTSGSDGAITVSVADRSSKVAEARFDAPTQTIPGATTVAEITRFITGVLPDVTVFDQTGSTQVAAQLDVERERWSDGVEKLADSIGAEVVADTWGNFIIRPQPQITDAPVWTLDAGDGGILLGEEDDTSRDLTYNRVVASGQRVDGLPPVYAVASDTNVNSPTYINGPFGVRTRFYASQLMTTTAQCLAAAQTLLDRVNGRHMDVSFTAVTNPALEAGDVIRLRFGDRDETHIIDRVEIPFRPGDPQQIKTRTPAIPEETLA